MLASQWTFTSTLRPGPRTAVAAGLFMLLASLAAAAEDRPTASQIETLLRDALTNNRIFVPSFYRNAKLKDFELLKLEGVASSRWYADVEMLFDFGILPPTIVGFDRERRGRYTLILQRQDTRLELLRFTPNAKVHLLPAKL